MAGVVAPIIPSKFAPVIVPVAVILLNPVTSLLVSTTTAFDAATAPSVILSNFNKSVPAIFAGPIISALAVRLVKAPSAGVVAPIIPFKFVTFALLAVTVVNVPVAGVVAPIIPSKFATISPTVPLLKSLLARVFGLNIASVTNLNLDSLVSYPIKPDLLTESLKYSNRIPRSYKSSTVKPSPDGPEPNTITGSWINVCVTLRYVNEPSTTKLPPTVKLSVTFMYSAIAVPVNIGLAIFAFKSKLVFILVPPTVNTWDISTFNNEPPLPICHSLSGFKSSCGIFYTYKIYIKFLN